MGAAEDLLTKQAEEERKKKEREAWQRMRDAAKDLNAKPAKKENKSWYGGVRG
jgi:hypothetical protein